MKIKILLLYFFILTPVYSYSLFDKNIKVQDGLNIINMSNTFAEIYEKLDSVNWAGKNINIAIESLEKIDKNVHIASTDERVILVFKDKIIANYPKPSAKQWDEFGQITTALILKIRQLVPKYKNTDEVFIYKLVVDVLIRSLDEKGKFIYSHKDKVVQDGKILTSLGIEGIRLKSNDFLITGVYESSVADLKGIEKNDIILAINGKDIKKINSLELNGILHGFNSGSVKLKIKDSLGIKDVVLNRSSIVLADTDIVIRKDANNEDSILEIIIHNITDNSLNIIKNALKTHQNIKGIILDLRSTSGNDEQSVTKLAGLFVGKEPIMRVVESLTNEVEISSSTKKQIKVPTVVLISNSTSGTAEILAYNLYEKEAGLIIGSPTSGEARLSTMINLSNGGGLLLYNKSIKTAKGDDLDGIGVFPIVCLANIRSSKDQEVFFLNVINENFDIKDYNNIVDKTNVLQVRKGCPYFISGFDEDNISLGVAVKILTDKLIYNKLIKKIDN